MAASSVPGAEEARRALIAVLQLAYSGERAAGYAYRGHWKSVADAGERERIRRIEEEEWHHRDLVGGILRDLGARPRRWREVRATVLGRALGLLCHVAGRFVPMYGAGRLESRNIREYEEAARNAVAAGRGDLLDCLLAMAEVEWEHELYFRGRVEGHRLLRLFPLWPAPPPKESIRARYAGPPLDSVA
jgi:rubrerythrin